MHNDLELDLEDVKDHFIVYFRYLLEADESLLEIE
jgi:hypothetical protein